MATNLIQTKTFAFSLLIVSVFKILQENREYILSKQLLRCATSVGAMVMEADHAESRADFKHKMSIAQKEINELSAQWQMEIEAKYESILQLEKAYQAEKILLTEDMRKKREGDIDLRKKEAMELQKSKFGLDGELFKKREELIAPIQEEIYKAIEEVASTSALMVVFDRSEQGNLLYTNPKHDISDKVLKKMGLKPGDTNEGGEEEEEEEKKPTDKPGSKPGSNTGKGGSGKSPPKRNP